MAKRKCPPYNWVGYKPDIVGISKNVAQDFKKDYERKGECAVIKKFKRTGSNYQNHVVYHAPLDKITDKVKERYNLR